MSIAQNKVLETIAQNKVLETSFDIDIYLIFPLRILASLDRYVLIDWQEASHA